MLNRDELIKQIETLHNKRLQRLDVLENNDPVMQNLNGQILALTQVIKIMETKEDGTNAK
ncbi:MAG: hypothetical protein KDH96_00800 [Candidatus Riesia sp.]|nr:hypothetical protein [Candidatus Riesia sp.]